MVDTKKRFCWFLVFYFLSLLFYILPHSASGADFGAVIPHVQLFPEIDPSDNIYIDLSADGKVIVGTENLRNSVGWYDSKPFHLNLNTGEISRLSSDGTHYSEAYNFTACSGTGALVVGRFHNLGPPWPGYSWQGPPFNWQNGRFISLQRLSGEESSDPNDISSDGTTAVGANNHHSLGWWYTAVRWDTTTGIATSLGRYANDDDSEAIAVSADGMVIIGRSGDWNDYWRPFLWRPSYGWYPLQVMYSGPYPSWNYWNLYGNATHDLSDDGKMAVGNLYDGSHILPVFWDLVESSSHFRDYTLLPLFYGSEHVSGRAYAASLNIPGHGYIIGGYSGSDNRQFGGAGHYPLVSEAVLWETEHLQTPPTRVETLLLGLGLADKIAGWKLTEVLSISDNGKTIAGRGIHPNGRYWYWYADLRNPPPNDTRAHAQYIGQSIGNLITHRVKTSGSTVDASPSNTPIATEGSKLRPTVWYSYKAAQDGYLSLDLAGTIDFSLLAVYREQETTPMATTYTCSDPDSVGPCFVPDELKIDADTMYYISVSGMEVPQGEESFDLYHQFTPITDQCTEAFFLEQILPTTVAGSTNDAETASAPTCDGVSVTAPGVWFRVVGTGGYMIASLAGAVDYDSKLSVYCSSCGPTPTCVAANDDIGGNYGTASEVGWCTNPGTVYDVLVHGFEMYAGNFRLTISEDPDTTCTPYSTVTCQPANSSCAHPTPLVETTSITNDYTLLADNTNATTTVSSTGCGQVNSDVWFSYTARCNGQVVVDTCQSEGSLANSVLAIYNACGGNELACNDNYSSSEIDCGQRSAIYLPAQAGEKLKIMVADYGTHVDTGTFPLRVQEIPDAVDIHEMSIADIPQGDSAHIQLPITGGCPRSGTGYFANISDGELPPGLTLDWNGLITGTATTSGRYQFTVHVFDGELSGSGHYDDATYTITVLADNDSCQDAKDIGEGMILFGNHGTTTSSSPSPMCESQSYSSDVWFRYTSSCSGKATVSTCGSLFDTVVSVYKGGDCTPEPQAQGCNINNTEACGTGSTGSSLTFTVQNGQQYLVRVAGNDPSGGAQGNGKLIVTCFDDCNNNGVSDLTDLASGTSLDKNSNGLPDECEPKQTRFPWPMFIPAITGAGR